MVSLICSVPIPFRNHFHYIPCPNLYYTLKSPTICFSYLRYPRKNPLFSLFLFFSISLSICFTPFQTETSRNSARLTCHFSYLFLVLLVLILFSSVRFILFQNK